jgi:hypothetical protein
LKDHHESLEMLIKTFEEYEKILNLSGEKVGCHTINITTVRTKSLYYLCIEKTMERNTPNANNDYLRKQEIWVYFPLSYLSQTSCN